MNVADDVEQLRARFEAAGQGHVFRFWDGLDAAGGDRLARQCADVDLGLLGRLAGLLSQSDTDGEAPQFEPPDLFPLERSDAQQSEATAATQRGAEALAAGRVGFVLVAGGQGSRLGYDGPKGCYGIGPLTDSPLFDWHAARIGAAAERHGFRPAWYVMTSPANDGPTREFFAANDHFGLPSDDVFFFSQAMLPALDAQGRIVLADRDSLFLAPNGHGGSLAALHASGALADMRGRGIDLISYFQVDNPLARPADPLFIGLHDGAGAGMSSKVVSKRDPGEKVGVIGRANGKLGCIEYSDLPAELRDARDDAGRLLFGAGNIAAHVLTRDFVESLNEGGELRLPWHLARKKLGTVDDSGQPVEVDGIKFETFVFDALGMSDASVTLEVERAVEFSPVKNAEGEDSPATCRADLSRHFAGLAAAAGCPAAPVDAAGGPRIEIDPRYAESSDELERRGTEPAEHAGGHLYRG